MRCLLESGTSRSRCDASLLFSGWQWYAFKGVVRFSPAISFLSHLSVEYALVLSSRSNFSLSQSLLNFFHSPTNLRSAR